MYFHYFNSNFNMTGGGMPAPVGAAAGVEKESATSKILPYLSGLCICSCVCSTIAGVANAYIYDAARKDPSNDDLQFQKDMAFRGFIFCLVCTICLTASIGLMQASAPEKK